MSEGLEMNERLERAEYLSELTISLADMARHDGHELLAYLLEMATLEARDRVKGLA